VPCRKWMLKNRRFNKKPRLRLSVWKSKQRPISRSKGKGKMKPGSLKKNLSSAKRRSRDKLRQLLHLRFSKKLKKKQRRM
jgi:hypothetical protein